MRGIRETGASGITAISHVQSELTRKTFTNNQNGTWFHNKSTESHSIPNKTQPIQNPATNKKAATLFTGINITGENLNF